VLGWDVSGPLEIRWADPANGVLVQTHHQHDDSAAAGRYQLRVWLHRPDLAASVAGAALHRYRSPAV